MIILLALAATLAPLDLLVEVQMKVGVCEEHLTDEQETHFDPYTTHVPRPVQDMLHKARVEGRKLGRELNLDMLQCERLLRE